MIFTELGYPLLVTVTLLLYAVLAGRKTGRTWLLLFASLFFYGWWSPRYLPLIFATSILDYVTGGLIHRARDPWFRRFVLLFSLAGNLGVLAYFKYANFFAANVDAACALLGLPAFFGRTYAILLPVGISFYTFQSMSYTLDIYFRRLEPCRSFLEFAAFVMFFPQLVAGPILRASEFLPQLDRVAALSLRSRGLFRILYGLGKKMWLSDALGIHVVDPAFADPASHAGFAMWIGVYAYAFQIFLDFSAYSDIAIGTARLFGFDLNENFRSPYLASDPREFWKRWHISFSTWLRDYLYIPLGGNRGGAWSVRRNLAVTMLLGGLWHGASWTFVAWGAWHGALLVLFRDRAFPAAVPRPLARFVFFNLVCFGWVLFRAGTLDTAIAVVESMAACPRPGVLAPGTLLLLAAAWFLHDVVEPRIERIDALLDGWPAFLRAAVVYAWILGVVWMWEAHVAQATFIYFQF